MPRNMSFMLTTEQYLNHTKTVTRRNGWEKLKVGELLNGIEKGQGLKKGEHVRLLGQHICVDNRREPLNAITKTDCIKEGFPQLEPHEFVEFYAKHNRCEPTTLISRIEFRHLIDSDALIAIPPEIAVCPYCDTKLTAHSEAWTQEDDDSWIATDVQVDCETEPDMESEEWEEWMKWHSDMPYVYMLPVVQTVTKWINSKYRFRL